MIVGSFSVTLLSCLLALPFALGASIFVVEVAPGFGSRVFRPLTEVLVGIPSVVFGLVGLGVVVPWMRGLVGGTGYGILSASIVLAVMILPTVTSLSTDALAAVPNSYRDGSYGLGCTRWQTVVGVVLPSALPDIMTAVIMGMSRAFGEALAVQMIIGNAPQMPAGLFTPASTLTSVLTMGMGNEAMGTVANDVLWALAMVLLAMSLVFILIVLVIGFSGFFLLVFLVILVVFILFFSFRAFRSSRLFSFEVDLFRKNESRHHSNDHGHADQECQ